jgi:hypothetical protein
VRPTADIVLASSALLAGQSTLVTLTFSEAIAGLDPADVRGTNGTVTQLTQIDATTWTAVFTPFADVIDSSNLVWVTSASFTDLAGNATDRVYSSASFTINTVRPAISSIVVADNVLTAGETTLVTFRFSEAVSDFDNDDLTVANGSLSTVTSNDGGLTWTATLTPSVNTNSSSGVITLDNTGYTNAAGNAGTGSEISGSYTVDTRAPTATISMTSNTLAAGASTLVTFTFSEAVSNFSDTNLTLAHGTLSALTSSDNIVWTATFTATTAVSSDQVVITLDQSGVTDLAGNSGVGSVSNPTVALPPSQPATPAAVIVIGDAGDNLLNGGAADDVLQGGRSDSGKWDFYLNAQGKLVAQHQPLLADASAVETLALSDLDHSTVPLAFAGADPALLASIAGLYATAFGRVPDLAGLNFWLVQGVTLAQAAQAFVVSAEFQQASGALDNAGLVHALYQYALGTAGAAAADAMAEQTAWIAKLDGASVPAAARAELLLSLSQNSATLAHWNGANGIAVASVVLSTEHGWIAGSGNDTLDGGAGNDLLVGGDGIDTVVYAGKLADYHFVLGQQGVVTIQQARAGGDIDTILQIEKGQFSDGTVDLNFTNSDTASLARIGLLYQTVLDRAADLPGLVHWDAQHLDPLDLAQAFIGSPEFQSRYGTLDNAAFATLIATNALNHAPDAASVQSWTTYLDTHSRADMVAALIGTPDVLAAQFAGAGLVLV